MNLGIKNDAWKVNLLDKTNNSLTLKTWIMDHYPTATVCVRYVSYQGRTFQSGLTVYLETEEDHLMFLLQKQMLEETVISDES